MLNYGEGLHVHDVEAPHAIDSDIDSDIDLGNTQHSGQDSMQAGQTAVNDMHPDADSSIIIGLPGEVHEVSVFGVCLQLYLEALAGITVEKRQSNHEAKQRTTGTAQ